MNVLLVSVHQQTKSYRQSQIRRYLRAHSHCQNNRAEIAVSRLCGCFYCLYQFHPRRLQWYDWVTTQKRGRQLTATCPRCHIDSVIGSAAGFPIYRGFLRGMQKRYFTKADGIK